MSKSEPKPCPFCGGETHINLGHLRAGVVHYLVDCISPECMYRSAHYTDNDADIDAHNRVCCAVESVNKGFNEVTTDFREAGNYEAQR